MQRGSRNNIPKTKERVFAMPPLSRDGIAVSFHQVRDHDSLSSREIYHRKGRCIFDSIEEWSAARVGRRIILDKTLA